MRGSARIKRIRKKMDDEMIVEGETILAYRAPGVPEPMVWNDEKGLYGPIDPERAEAAHSILSLAGYYWCKGVATDEERAELLPEEWREGFLAALAKSREDYEQDERLMVSE